MAKQRRTTWLALVIFLIVTGALWHQLFVATGLLWWQAPQAAERPAPPAPASWPSPVTSWVDLPAYAAANPVWSALR